MRKALTLIEMIVVICIIGILAGLLVPTLAKARHEARINATADTEKVGTEKLYNLTTYRSEPTFSEKPGAWIYIISPADGKVIAIHEVYGKVQEDTGIRYIAWFDKNKVEHRQYLCGQIVELTNQPLKIEGNFIIRE